MYSDSEFPLASGPGSASPEASTDMDQFLLKLRRTVGEGLQALLREDEEQVGEAQSEADTALDSEPLLEGTVIKDLPGSDVEPVRGERRRAVAGQLRAGFRAARELAAEGLDATRQAAANGIEAGAERLGEVAESRRAENERLDKLYRIRRTETKRARRLRREIDGHMKYLGSRHVVFTTNGTIEEIARRQIQEMADMGFDYFDGLYQITGR